MIFLEYMRAIGLLLFAANLWLGFTVLRRFGFDNYDNHHWSAPIVAGALTLTFLELIPLDYLRKWLNPRAIKSTGLLLIFAGIVLAVTAATFCSTRAEDQEEIDRRKEAEIQLQEKVRARTADTNIQMSQETIERLARLRRMREAILKAQGADTRQSAPDGSE